MPIPTLRTLLFGGAFVALTVSSAVAQSPEDCSTTNGPAREPQVAARIDADHLPADISAPQTMSVAGHCLAFHSIAGSLRLNDEKGEPRADVAFVAYLLDGADVAHRPLTFAINGGPGAASAWLDLGAIGPWRLPMQGLAPSTLPQLVDNAETWLGFTDLVFIDPPGTGYSRLRGNGDAARSALWSVNGDINALAVFIRRWLVTNRRLESPKFVVGESYGGFRGPRLAKELATEQGVGLDGLVLLSPVLDFADFLPGPDNPFALLTRLPSYAAVAKEAKGPVSRADLADVEHYATGEYLQDWLAGPRDHSAVERKTSRVAEITGLDAETVGRYGGDLQEHDYLNELGRIEGKSLAYYDATITAGDPFPVESFGNALDPVTPGFEPAFTSAMVGLYQRKLGWRIDDAYELLSSSVNREWSWGKGLTMPNAILDLREMLALDPHFRVLIEHGLTDVQAPYFATAIQLARIPDYDPSGRLTLNVHPGGHMFYSRDASRKALHDEAERLIAPN